MAGGIKPGQKIKRVDIAAHMRIVRLTKYGASCAEVAQDIGSDVQLMSVALQMMRDSGHMHICGWKKALKGPNVPVYMWGAGDDAPYPNPDYTPRAVSESVKNRSGTVLFLKLWDALEWGGRTTPELAEYTGMTKATIRRAIRAGRANRVVYVDGWKQGEHGGVFVATYAAGSNVDVVRPKPKGNTEYCRAYQRKLKVARGAAPAGYSIFSVASAA